MVVVSAKSDKYDVMSRPKPTIILEYANKKNFKVEQVLDAEAIWAVFFKNKPFNLKSGSLVSNYPGPKYKKTSFSNPGHAINLAKKLNKLFKCEDFQVVKLTAGEIVKWQD
jgi:hypothetical protein